MIVNTFAALDLHVSISAEPLFTLWGVAITNATLTGAIGALITFMMLYYVARKVSRGQYNRFVGLVQWAFELLQGQINDVIPNKELARKITPLAVTIFFLVLINYWLSLIPGLESIKFNGVPLLRSAAADVNFTFALAIISLVTAQMYAVKYLGAFGNIKRYLRNPIKDPVGAFEGLLEVIGEISRYTSLSLRLFGNAFAGEILLIIIAILTSYLSVVILPVFLGFELFIGFIQAYVFFVLTIIFIALAQDAHAPDDAKKPEHSPVETPNAVGRLE